MKSKSFEDVVVWQKAHSWVLAVYRFTEKFPKHETFGLASQFRRAAVSVPANFAEGFKKRGSADKVRFYNIAQGSLEGAATIRFYHAILATETLASSLQNLKK
jgi:four helix bundle protein